MHFSLENNFHRFVYIRIFFSKKRQQFQVKNSVLIRQPSSNPSILFRFSHSPSFGLCRILLLLKIKLPVNFEDSRTIDLCLMHRGEGTEHFHSLKTTRQPTVRMSNRVVRRVHTRLAVYPNIFVSRHRLIFPSSRIPAETKIEQNTIT